MRKCADWTPGVPRRTQPAVTTSMKLLLFLYLLLVAGVQQTQAQSDLIAISYKGRIEYYWVLYTSPNGRHTKITNYNSAISFYVDTGFLNSITISRPPERLTRVVRISR